MTFVGSKREKSGGSAALWYIAVYVRLSKEDGDKVESDSIQNQKGIIEQHIRYLQGQGEQVASVEVYSDDGCPGGNFDRPEYRRMIADIEAGRINCVIFKDNSRLGRNYPELGRLMEEYFPQKGVRVISVLNHIDSVRDPTSYCSAIVSFSNIMNDQVHLCHEAGAGGVPGQLRALRLQEKPGGPAQARYRPGGRGGCPHDLSLVC